ncbi:MAG: hypothetical protein HYW05_01705, partial [Candidatus Diapherotrites archaeon]|nr:hypothetical protein [Candidatus Diapherotrites archaeon]
MNTRETRHTVMPLMNDIRRYPLMRSLEQTLSSKVNQGIISKDLAGRFFRDLIADIGRKVYDIDVDSKKIEKIRHESKTQREGLRRIVH